MMAERNPLGPALGGLAGWLLVRMRRRPERPARLALIERISLAPRQSLALVEAEGNRFLIATSPECAPVFFSLDGNRLSGAVQGVNPRAKKPGAGGRASW